MSAKQLTALGWTPDKLRERIAGCRAGRREARERGGSAAWTYRYLFARLYAGYKRDLATISVRSTEWCPRKSPTPTTVKVPIDAKT